MKKIFIIVAILINSICAFSQSTLNQRIQSKEKEIDDLARQGWYLIGMYQSDDLSSNPLWGGTPTYKEFSIRATQDKETTSLIINIECYGDYLTDSRIQVFPEDLPMFVAAIETIRDKFIEWSKVAKNNAVTNFEKNIPIDSNIGVYREGLIPIGYRRDPMALCEVSANFKVDTDGKPSVEIEATNKNVKPDGSLLFKNVEKLKAFASIIQPDHIASEYERTKRKIIELENDKSARDALFQ